MFSESGVQSQSLSHRNCYGQWLRVVEKFIGYFVGKIEFFDWPRDLTTSCGRQHDKLLALESDIPAFKSRLHGILAM